MRRSVIKLSALTSWYHKLCRGASHRWYHIFFFLRASISFCWETMVLYASWRRFFTISICIVLFVHIFACLLRFVLEVNFLVHFSHIYSFPFVEDISLAARQYLAVLLWVVRLLDELNLRLQNSQTYDPIWKTFTRVYIARCLTHELIYF